MNEEQKEKDGLTPRLWLDYVLAPALKELSKDGGLRSFPNKNNLSLDVNEPSYWAQFENKFLW